ncbi:RHS repeat domain-containing protein [Phytohabitans rumicis]|uniref:Type IV secretion protein Rhs n=1 Tax=Phytohabitans rumicis TaxID=1076125 RepID=A0A6V8LMG8_9ACTN|nr:RHS repeat-associated core domain-containing protein [Phytohabitans rumicis]GFJ95297.1 hypothetical protein Prum_089390 [Phytohabitans rumicis]
MRTRRTFSAALTVVVTVAMFGAAPAAAAPEPGPAAAPELPSLPGQTAPAAGALASPRPGDVTAGMVVLAAPDLAPAQVTYQWRRATVDDWADIDPAHVSAAAGGTALAWNVRAALDAAESPARDGPLEVRATYPGGASAPVRFLFDGDLASAASQPLGPGMVNLETGELTLPGRGLSVASYGSDLAVGTTFRSRHAGVLDGAGIFGPGWVTTVGVSSLGARYGRLRVTGSLVHVGLADGTALGFTAVDPTRYAPPPGHETLALVREAGGFRLTDERGVGVTFTPIGDAYYPAVVSAPGTGQVTTVSWEATQTAARPTRILAPAPDGVDCTAPVRGCRLLTFSYADQATGDGDHPGRLRQIALTSWDPDATPPGMRTVPLARYRYDEAGRLRAAWDPRLDYPDEAGAHHVADTYGYAADGSLAEVGPAGEQPWQLTYTTVPGDPGAGRVAAVSRTTGAGTARTSVVYRVPVAGPPFDMSVAQTARWGQDPAPVRATAVFPPGQVPDGDQPAGVPPAAWQRATVIYLDGNGRAVNMVSPGGHASTTWYDRFGNVARGLSAANRARALAAGADSAALADRLSTVYVYDAGGRRVLETFGPEHDVMVDGAVVRGRQHSRFSYDEGAPAYPDGTGPGLLTTRIDSVRHTGSTDSAARTTRYEYDWELRRPTATVVDPGGLALTEQTTYDPETGLPTRTASTAPAAVTPADLPTSGARQTVYYGAGTGHPECDNRPEWANLPCRVQPADATRPWTTYTYDQYFQPRTVTERTADAVLRTTTIGYDGAGRAREVAVSGIGAPVPVRRTAYAASTGLVERTESVQGGAVVAQILRRHDGLGRPVGYTDADGTESSTAYHPGGQVATASDGKGTRAYGYDERGLPVTVTDSLVGTFTAGYDPDGNVVSQTWPAGVSVHTTYDETGLPVGLRYERPGCGQPTCTLYGETLVPTAHGQVARQTGTGPQRSYGYDAAGRLTSVEEGAAADCARRTYGFDGSTNRTTSTAAACTGDPPTSTRSWAYDAADRLVTPGTTYDQLGRTTAVPAADLVQGSDLAVTYHVTDMVRSITQAGRTAEYALDAGGDRIRSWTDSGVERRHHYQDDSDSPSWTEESTSTWSRQIRSVSGFAGVHGGGGLAQWQLTSLRGDVVATLEGGGPAAHPADEYGRAGPGTGVRRYGWLGAYQRAADTPGGLVLLGVRLYNPATGRFLTVDPIDGGNANDYEYCTGDPVNCHDLDGRAGGFWRKLLGGVIAVVGVVGALACGVSVVCGVAVGIGAAGAGYTAVHAGTPDWSWRGLFTTMAIGGGLGLLGPLSSGVRGRIGQRVADLPYIGQRSRLFGRLNIPGGVQGSLNHGGLRIGWWWTGTAAAGRPVFRIAIGGRHYRINWHIDIL